MSTRFIFISWLSICPVCSVSVFSHVKLLLSLDLFDLDVAFASSQQRRHGSCSILMHFVAVPRKQGKPAHRIFHNNATLADIRQFDQRQGRGLRLYKCTKLALLVFLMFLSLDASNNAATRYATHVTRTRFFFALESFKASINSWYLLVSLLRRDIWNILRSGESSLAMFCLVMVGFRCFSKESVPPSCHWQGEQQAERAAILDLEKLHWQGCSPTIAMLVTRWCVGTLTSFADLWCPLCLREREEMRKQEVLVQRPSTKIELVRIFSSSPSLLFWCCTSPGFHVSWFSTWSHKI